jgi:hypothetical protein
MTSRDTTPQISYADAGGQEYVLQRDCTDEDEEEMFCQDEGAIRRFRESIKELSSAKSSEHGVSYVPLPGDVFIVTSPKCGTTLLQQVHLFYHVYYALPSPHLRTFTERAT